MAFVVSEGSLRALEQPMAQAPYALRLTDDLSQDYATIWRTQQSVRTVVSFLARNIASLGLHTFRRVSDTDRERLTDHPLAKLLAAPNPFTTRYRFIDAMVHDLGIYDNAYLLKFKSPGLDMALVRIPPEKIKPTEDGWLAASRYVIEGNRGKTTVSADQVVHLRGYSPSDPRVGCSPLESLRRILVEEYEAGRMREQVLRNGARTSGYIERPAGASWSEAAKQRFRSQWQAQYAGSGPSAGGTPILEDGMKFVAASMTAEQLQYVEGRKLTREEVASAYFIPPPMVGILDNASFSNITEQHKMLYQDTLGPWLTMLVEDLQLQLLGEFADQDGIYLEFNLAEKLKGSFEEQAAAMSTMVGAPVMTRDEGRARLNLPEIGGEAGGLVTPLNVLVGGQASPRDTAPPTQLAGVARTKMPAPELKVRAALAKTAAAPHREKVAEVLRGFFDRQGKTVLSRLGAGEEWWDGKRWDDELTDDLLKVSHTLAALLGSTEAERLGYADGYDPDMTVNFLRKVAADRAAGINATTKAQLDEQLAADGDPAVVFETASNDRSMSTATSVATFVGAFAAVEAGRQIAEREGVEPTKTWVTGPNPRASHASMDGETVPIGEAFSNGMEWPGQGSSDDAGCNCSVSISL